MTDLLKLAERVESATENLSTLNHEIAEAMGWLVRNALDQEVFVRGKNSSFSIPRFTSSLDAAMTLDAPELAEYGGALAFLREAMDRLNRVCVASGKDALPRFLTAAFLRGRADALKARASLQERAS